LHDPYSVLSNPSHLVSVSVVWILDTSRLGLVDGSWNILDVVDGGWLVLDVVFSSSGSLVLVVVDRRVLVLRGSSSTCSGGSSWLILRGSSSGSSRIWLILRGSCGLGARSGSWLVDGSWVVDRRVLVLRLSSSSWLSVSRGLSAGGGNGSWLSVGHGVGDCLPVWWESLGDGFGTALRIVIGIVTWGCDGKGGEVCQSQGSERDLHGDDINY